VVVEVVVVVVLVVEDAVVVGLAGVVVVLVVVVEVAIPVEAPGPTSMFNLQLPPHMLVLSPEHFILHSESFVATARGLRVFEQ